jgi:hypothetical protein
VAAAARCVCLGAPWIVDRVLGLESDGGSRTHKWVGLRVPKATQAIATVGWSQILVFSDQSSDDESKYMY